MANDNRYNEERENATFAVNLRKLFEDKKATHNELACFIKEKTGDSITRQAVGQWCNGNSSPNLKTVPVIAEFFGVSSDYLLGMSEVRSTDVDIKAVCKYTGLSEKSVRVLLSACKYDAYCPNGKLKKYSLVDTLNCVIAELGLNTEALFALYECLNENNSFYSSENELNDFEDDFNEMFPKASAWLKGKGVIYDRSKNFIFMRQRVETLFSLLLSDIIKAYNPDEFEKTSDFYHHTFCKNISDIADNEKEFAEFRQLRAEIAPTITKEEIENIKKSSHEYDDYNEDELKSVAIELRLEQNKAKKHKEGD